VISIVPMTIKTIKGPYPLSFSPGINLCLEGSPKKYLIGPGDLAIRKAIPHVLRVVNVIVPINEPRYGIHNVPDVIPTKTCWCNK
jgi:hypothetical protein